MEDYDKQLKDKLQVGKFTKTKGSTTKKDKLKPESSRAKLSRMKGGQSVGTIVKTKTMKGLKLFN